MPQCSNKVKEYTIEYEWRVRFNIGAGLQNLTNNCYSNAVLQSLAYCPPLINYFFHNSTHRDTCKRSSECMQCQITNFFDELFHSTERVINAAEFCSTISYMPKFFSDGEQEDAHEFLKSLLESLRLSKLESRTKDQKTYIDFIFRGLLQTKIICYSCHNESCSKQHFSDINLEILDHDSIQESLNSFTEAEVFEGENSYYCELCCRQRPAWKQCTIYNMPHVFILYLMRFNYSDGHLEKNDAYIHFPYLLDVSTLMTKEPINSLWYRLYSVIVHRGENCENGHYYTYVDTRRDGWYKFDDKKVKSVDVNEVLDDEAYILFYIKVPSWDLSTYMAIEESMKSRAKNDASASQKVDTASTFSLKGIMNYLSPKESSKRKLSSEELPQNEKAAKRQNGENPRLKSKKVVKKK